jgi:hypothetical protein
VICELGIQAGRLTSPRMHSGDDGLLPDQERPLKPLRFSAISADRGAPPRDRKRSKANVLFRRMRSSAFQENKKPETEQSAPGLIDFKKTQLSESNFKC